MRHRALGVRVPVFGCGPASQIAEHRGSRSHAAIVEPRFAQLMHASPTAIAISNLRLGCYVDVNPSYARLMGYTRDEFIGRSSVDLNLWADLTQRDEFIRRVDLGLNIDRERIVIRTKDGLIRHVIISAEITTFDDEPCVLSQLIDVTESHQQAKELEKSEARLRALFDSAAEGIFVQERDGSISMVNASAGRIFGMSPEEILADPAIGNKLQICRADGSPFLPEDRPVTRALRTGEPQFDSEMRLTRLDGRTIWISINSRPIFSGDDPVPCSVVASFTDVTERYMAEAALRASEERFRTLAAAAPIGVYYTDPDGNCVFTNRKWEEISGISQESSQGNGWIAAIHPDDRTSVFAAWDQAIRDQIDFSLEYRFLRPDGKVRIVEGHAAPIRNDENEITGYVGTVEDITERRETENELRLSEENFRRSYERALTGMAANSPHDGRFLRVNPALCAMTGYSELELLSMSPADITHPDDREQDAAMLQSLLAGERLSYRREKRYLTRFGRELWVEVSVALVRDDSGNPLEFVAQIQDISARKAAEDTLRDSEARFRALLANGADIVLLVDRTGIVRWASPSVHRTLGIEPGEMIGRSNIDLIHPDDHRALRRGFVATLRATDAPHGSTLRFRHKDGSYRWLEAVGANHLNNPAIGGIVFNARDITDRVELEERLRQDALHDHLTGLPNRSHFMMNLESALAAARRYHDQVGVLFIDLDDFKPVNDQLGHAAGDQVLIAVGKRLTNTVRPTDIVARLGGDEYAVVLNRVRDREEVQTVIDRLVTAFESPLIIPGMDITLHASIGMAMSGDGFDTPDRMLAVADQSMYRKKYEAKHRVIGDRGKESHQPVPSLTGHGS